MITFTPDGRHVLAAVEGEPDKDPPSADKIDPEGSVAILDLDHGLANARLRLARFGSDAQALVSMGVRIGVDLTDTEPNPLKRRLNSVAKDMEPEFIAVSRELPTAYVTLQENNAVAIVDINSATVTDIRPLGLKDHDAVGAGLDPSRKDAALLLPSAERCMASPPPPPPGDKETSTSAQAAPRGLPTRWNRGLRTGGKTYLVTANEGDARNGDFDITTVADFVRYSQAEHSA